MPNPDPADREAGALAWHLHTTMPDGSVWSVPVRFIAHHRARYYAEIDHVSFQESLMKDTLPLFEGDDYEIADWAANNMNWSDVVSIAKQVCAGKVDWEEGWTNGDKHIEKGRP